MAKESHGGPQVSNLDLSGYQEVVRQLEYPDNCEYQMREGDIANDPFQPGSPTGGCFVSLPVYLVLIQLP